MPLASDFHTLAFLRERILPAIEKRAAGAALRVWVPGCASGEDVYALAMVLMGYLEANRLVNDVQVFGSDSDPAALVAARAAVYPASVRGDFAQAGLERFFHEEKNDYRVVKRIRDCVLFSEHDLHADPPFPRLSLVFGGALFSDLPLEGQIELLQVLRYAIVPHGWLLLGARPIPAATASLFTNIDGEPGIFQRREEPAALPASRLHRPAASTATPAKRSSERPGLGGAVEGLILQNYAPACVIINDQHQVVYRVGEISRYLQQPQGAPTQDLLCMAKPELRAALRVLLQASLSEGTPLRIESVEFHDGNAVVPLSIDARALPTPGGGAAFRALVFRERAGSGLRVAGRSDSSTNGAARSPTPSEPILVRPELQGEELPSANEDLASYNEELMSLNEELQSSNEELVSSREQIQSVNEEMDTVNGELRANIVEADRLNDDLRNLIENTQIATLFLDRELRVRTSTPTARDLFRLIAADRGRLLTDIAPRFAYPELNAELSHVLRTRAFRETQVQTSSHWYMLRILPYLTLSGEVDGVVLTFTDITKLKRAELEVTRLGAALAKQVEWLRTLVDVVPVGIAFHEIADGSLRVNRSAAELIQLHATDAADRNGLTLALSGGELSPAQLALREAMSSPEDVNGLEVELDLDAKSRRHVLVHAAPLRDAAGAVYAKVSGLLDITDSKLAREQASAREHQQAVVAELGLRALESDDLDIFLTQCVQAIGRGAGAELCDLTRLSEDGQSLQPVAAWGFEATTFGQEAVEPGSGAHEALGQRDPVVLSVGLSESERWPSHLRRENVSVGARIAIRTDLTRAPFGLLGAYRRTGQEFSTQDLLFLRSIANVLTSAVHRRLIEQARLRDSQAAALRESERQLQRSERLASLGTFATGIAHELNNPLSNIVLSAEYAAKTPDATRRERMLDAIRDNALRCGRIVESVLRFARDEVTEKWPNDLNPIARHAAQLVASYLGTGKLDIVFELAEPSPRLNCNPTEIEQVFVNLLKNASQAQPEQCLVRIRTAISGKDVLIAVEDNGPGIPEANLERIFDPFFSSQHAAGGTGLGLSITHRILATHGGSIRASNFAGGGARFEIRLPLPQSSAPMEQHEGT